MAKKKLKTRIKLNNKIRKIFGNIPFDEGVATLPDDVLMELALIVELELDSLDREVIIRGLRRTWSEGQYHHRKNIVGYLSAKIGHQRPPRFDETTPPTGTVETILSLLDGIPHTPDEEQVILEHYVEARPSKITADKISNTLRYLRLNRRFKGLEDRLSVEFSTTGEMEFHHAFRFALPEHDFSKTLLVVSHGLGLEALLDEDDDALIARLSLLKESLIDEKQSRIDTFVHELLGDKHPYLSTEQIASHLRRLPPEGDLLHNPIDFMICETIVRNIHPSFHLISTTDHYTIARDRVLIFQETPLPYRTSVSYDKLLFFAMIWRGDSLPISEDMAVVDAQMIEHFNVNIQELYDETKALASGIEIEDVIVWKHILQFVEPQLISSRNLKIKSKTHRRILYHFGEYLRPLQEKKRREELLAKTIRDFKHLFPLARKLKRHIVFHVGPTNSGKTYTAMEHLRAAQTGYYLAPLRLLALEGYESLREHGVATSLITGEEEIVDEESTHISSTIEMLNFEADVVCCVIDEIQMIADRDRGWAWANALIGAPAHTVILTGSVDAIPAVRALAEYLGETLDVIHFERKNPLEVMRVPVPLKKVKPLTALVAFSRKEVLSLRQRLASHHRVSVIYGNLSPEVRREEARKFREGESDVLVATDAIAMGLNLPIRTLLFTRDNKFDGLRRRELTTAEILQIAGRAGRYGIQEHGFVGALDAATLETIEGKFYAPLPDIQLPISIMASLHHVMLIGEILETDDLLTILSFFAENMEFEGPFRAANIESMLEIAEIVGQYDLDLRARYHLSTAPVSINSPYIESVFHRYLKHLQKDQSVPYIPPRDLPPYAHTNEELLTAEDRVKEVSLYLWLGFRFDEQFPDVSAAIEARTRLNRFIETSLAKGDFVKRCRRCGTILDLSYRFNICEQCYHKGKTGTTRRYGKRRHG
jgi:ATP-dependent RNA helicase SUPV3L1/SUV3